MPATQRSIFTNCSFKIASCQLTYIFGNVRRMDSIRYMFQSMINQNAALPNIQKMQYLIAALKGEARDISGSLEVSNENYMKAWETLKKRYDDSGFIVQKHIKALFEFPVIIKENLFISYIAAMSSGRYLETFASIKGIEKTHRTLGRLNNLFGN